MRTRLPLLITSTLIAATLSACAQQKEQPPPESVEGAASVVYKTIGDVQLKLHIFEPPHETDAPRPAIVFFFGGGWVRGSVMQFVPHAKYLAEQGMVAVVADYRVKSRHEVTPFECVADAHSAMTWLRTHADDFNIDVTRIVAAGGSAGGQLAASTAIIDNPEGAHQQHTDNNNMPAALVLFNPVVDMDAFFRDRPVTRSWPRPPEAISPLHHVRKGLPPTLIFHGTADKTVPIDQAIRFCNKMKAQGNLCELITFDGRGHGFFNADKGDGSDFRTTLKRTRAFLAENDLLPASPKVD